MTPEWPEVDQVRKELRKHRPRAQRPPDVVPPPADLPPLPTGFGVQTETCEVTERGVAREVTRGLVRGPYMSVEELMNRNRGDREEDE